MSKKRSFWRINREIYAQELRVIGVDGKSPKVMALDKALTAAKEAGLDLVEIAPKAKPPVVKIVDFGKFRYQEEKKLKSQKKKTKQGELKEVRFSPFIAQQDYETRLARVKGFTEEGNKVRLVVKFKGRQMGSKSFGYSLLKKILDEFGDTINIDMEPKFIGRHLAMIISPKAKAVRREKENAKTKN